MPCLRRIQKHQRVLTASFSSKNDASLSRLQIFISHIDDKSIFHIFEWYSYMERFLSNRLRPVIFLIFDINIGENLNEY